MKRREHLWLPLDLRLSFQYRLGWEGDDRWRQIGKMRELRAYPKIWDEESESYTRTRIVSVRSAVSRRQIKLALQQSFTFGCHCEHDCCGHAFCGHVEVRRIKGREYLVTQYVYHNC